MAPLLFRAYEKWSTLGASVLLAMVALWAGVGVWQLAEDVWRVLPVALGFTIMLLQAVPTAVIGLTKLFTTVKGLLFVTAVLLFVIWTSLPQSKKK